jgi:hypothetical protein
LRCWSQWRGRKAPTWRKSTRSRSCIISEPVSETVSGAGAVGTRCAMCLRLKLLEPLPKLHV